MQSSEQSVLSLLDSRPSSQDGDFRLVLLRLMRPPHFLVRVSEWIMVLGLLSLPFVILFFGRINGAYPLETIQLVCLGIAASLLLWFVSVLTLTGSRLSRITNIQSQSNEVCGHEILLTPLDDKDVLSAIVRSHWLGIYLLGVLSSSSYFCLTFVARDHLAYQGYGYTAYDVVGRSILSFIVYCTTTCPIAVVLWILFSLLVLRRVSLRMKGVWMFVLAAFLICCALMAHYDDYAYFYYYSPSVLAIGAAVCATILYFLIRYLGLPKGRTIRNMEVWVAFGLATGIGVLAMLGSTSVELESVNRNLPLSALLCFSVWNPLVAKISEAPYFAIDWVNWALTLALQLLLLRGLWPLALEAIHETRAAQ